MRRVGTPPDSRKERGQPSSMGRASAQGREFEYGDPVKIPPQQMGEAPEGFTTRAGAADRASGVFGRRLSLPRRAPGETDLWRRM